MALPAHQCAARLYNSAQLIWSFPAVTDMNCINHWD